MIARAEDRAALVVTLAFVILLGLWFVDRGKRSGMAPATAALNDSLERTKPAFDSGVAARAALDSARARQDAQLAAAARRALTRASQEKARADSLGAIADHSAGDAAAWQAAYASRTHEAAGWRTAIDTLNQRVDSLKAANDTLRFERDRILRPRLAATERLNLGLKTDLARTTECAIVNWPVRVRCPTRKEAAVVSLVLGAIAENRRQERDRRR